MLQYILQITLSTNYFTILLELCHEEQKTTTTLYLLVSVTVT